MASLNICSIRDLLAGLQERKFTSVDLVQVCSFPCEKLLD